MLRKTGSKVFKYEDLTNHPEMIIDYVIAAMTRHTKNCAYKNETRRLDVITRSSAAARVANELIEKWKKADLGVVIDPMLLFDPPLGTVELKMTDPRSGIEHTYTAYKTPTPNNQGLLNDGDVVTQLGVRVGGNTYHPAVIHVSPCPPENLQASGNDDALRILPNNLIEKATKIRCGLNMFKDSRHIEHDTVFGSMGMKRVVMFHLNHWKNSCSYKKGDKLYEYVWFYNNPQYDSFNQVRFNGVSISHYHPLMVKTILHGQPCACVEITLGSDLVDLSDIGYKFIRINGDMKKQVGLSFDDECLVVTPYNITAKM